jgi:HD-GYP domain-containing protein (c-di-GMP phosphodiesterase class II)
MAYIPNDILMAADKLSETDDEIIAKHPHVGYQLLQRLGHWDEAASIVIQHHERLDGKGYPYGLKENEICNGAKLLAVADTFTSLTTERADRSRRRTVLRALMEINNHIGTQFDHATVLAFTQMATERYKTE